MERLLHVFLTSQTKNMYKLLYTRAEQLPTPKHVDDLDMQEIEAIMEQMFDPRNFVVRERFKYWSNVSRKIGETIQELANRIRQEASTCDFSSIDNPQDEALRTKFMCFVQKWSNFEGVIQIASKWIEFRYNRSYRRRAGIACCCSKRNSRTKHTRTKIKSEKSKPKHEFKNTEAKSFSFVKGVCYRCAKEF